jgi:hypothetical protein
MGQARQLIFPSPLSARVGENRNPPKKKKTHSTYRHHNEKKRNNSSIAIAAIMAVTHAEPAHSDVVSVIQSVADSEHAADEVQPLLSPSTTWKAPKGFIWIEAGM